MKTQRFILERGLYKLHITSGIASLVFFSVFVSSWQNSNAQNPRTEILLNNNWHTIANDTNQNAYKGFEKTTFTDYGWKKVDVPHNWDAYEGYRRMRHGNRHGYAWYRKTFTVKPQPAHKKYFLFFEGVGSYATVWLNGKQVGYHAGGRTTFTLDVTEVIQLNNQKNLLAVRADHPANIQDLPWVCGGCSNERGFSEGSQPMGIFRPVRLIITNDVKVEPFGVHIWNDTTVTRKSARLFLSTEIKNYGTYTRNITVLNSVMDRKGRVVARISSQKKITPATTVHIKQSVLISNPQLWSLDDPYLYTMVTDIIEKGKLMDRSATPYGIRWISWPVGKKSKQFLLNGKPVFINGIAEYEHLLGGSHAFSGEQIRTRVMQVRAAGFNAFRDAHHPHNLRYQHYWDSLGLLWWTQMGAHIWYDSPAFRNHFKVLLKEWVKERRNSPSLVLWGLQNESKLPETFAKECTAIIRELDPTASTQRLVTTCNGGSGTDWDVPQNWSGTYGGNPATYAEDIQKQVLVGEYGAWRTLDLHTEGPFVPNGINSEDRMTQLMELKVRLADSVKDKTAGHFMWLLTSHDNPGRVQGGEGFRELDRIGPVNYKGLLTPWEEPLDVFYMFRSNYASKQKEPMVYIVSHTWPDRWTTTGKKDSILVYSNCDEVELFNDVEAHSLGKRKRNGTGTHFQWDDADIQYNVLYAIGYVNGKVAAKDYCIFHHLPPAPHFNAFFTNARSLTAPQRGYNYLYRVNCGGGTYKDENENTWMADRQWRDTTSWGSSSWAADFPGMPPFFASQRRTNDPVSGTRDWTLFQSFRFGREKLRFQFPVPDGDYLVELYFAEPWLGTGGGMDCTGWRLFDVAINGKTVLKDIDLWKEAGHEVALKKTVRAKITGGQLIISFPRIASGQAVISAIAVASLNPSIKPAPAALSIVDNLTIADPATGNWKLEEWLDTGDGQYTDKEASFVSLPPNLYGTTWIKTPYAIKKTTSLAQFTTTDDADVYIGLDASIKQKPEWLKAYEDTKNLIRNDKGKTFRVYRKRFPKGAIVVLGANGTTTSEEAAMYVTAVAPVYKMEPAYDLKPVASYKAVNAFISGPGIGKGKVEGKDRVLFKKASAENLLEWTIAVGVADRYSLTISYTNPSDTVVGGTLELFSADGSLLKKEAIEFTQTRPGKSNYINSSTGTMINAGQYKLRLTSKDAENISVNALDVQ